MLFTAAVAAATLAVVISRLLSSSRLALTLPGIYKGESLSLSLIPKREAAVDSRRQRRILFAFACQHTATLSTYSEEKREANQQQQQQQQLPATNTTATSQPAN